jgi:hypothetical protein
MKGWRARWPTLRLDCRASNGITVVKKMGKFQKLPELKKRTIKKGKIHNRKTWYDWSYASLQVELTSINAKKIAVDSVLFKKTIFVEF